MVGDKEREDLPVGVLLELRGGDRAAENTPIVGVCALSPKLGGVSARGGGGSGPITGYEAVTGSDFTLSSNCNTCSNTLSKR